MMDDLLRALTMGKGQKTVPGISALASGMLVVAMAFAPFPSAVSDDFASKHAQPADLDAEEVVWQEYQAWSSPIWCALLSDEQAMVRVLASLVVEGTGWVVEASECLQNSNPVAPLEVRQAALREGWDEPEVIATIYLADCHRHSVDSSGCDQAAVQQRLVAIDPENAFAQITALTERYPSKAEAEPFNPAEKAALKRAASAPFYREYAYAGVYVTYRAFEREKANHQRLALSPTALADARIDLHEDVDFELVMSAIEMFAVIVATANASYSALLDGCDAAQASGDQGTVDDCMAVARMMQSSGESRLVRMIGRGIASSMHRIAMYPDLPGAEADKLDPNRWKRQLLNLVEVCETQKGLPGIDEGRLSGQMPQSHLALFLEDFQKRGEVAANRNASAREYARYPQDFAFDPARCEDILALDEPVQRDLVNQWKAGIGGGTGAWEEVFRSAAKSLDQQKPAATP